MWDRVEVSYCVPLLSIAYQWHCSVVHAYTWTCRTPSKYQGSSMQKECFNLPFMANASSTGLESTVIYTAHNPLVYNNLDASVMIVHKLTTKKSWVFSVLSLTWFDNCLVQVWPHQIPLGLQDRLLYSHPHSNPPLQLELAMEATW